jgi:hypothetical protein
VQAVRSLRSPDAADAAPLLQALGVEVKSVGPERPNQVSIAIVLAGISPVVEILVHIADALSFTNIEQPATTQQLIYRLIWPFILLTSVWLAFTGRNVGRRLVAIFAAIYILSFNIWVDTLIASAFDPIELLLVAVSLLGTVGAIMLFFPKANGWYRAMETDRFNAGHGLDSAISRRLVSIWPKSGKFGINLDPVHCPNCGELQPASRKPANKREMLWGGWTCEKCGAKMDKYGKQIYIDT